MFLNFFGHSDDVVCFELGGEHDELGTSMQPGTYQGTRVTWKGGQDGNN